MPEGTVVQLLLQRDRDEAHSINAAREIHADDPGFGYRFIADEQESWTGPPIHDDFVERLFSVEAANQVWLTNITEHHTDEGKLYHRRDPRCDHL